MRRAQTIRGAKIVNGAFHVQVQALVKQLELYVDTFVGDALAELPDQERTAGGPLSSLAQPLLSFATALLKFKLSMPSTVKLLRRLLAALLPDGRLEGRMLVHILGFL